MLYLISTPIGNLEDFSLRAIKTIESADYLLCEDTRRTKILLNHYHLQKPLKSYHKFNEARRLEEIIEDLKRDKIIALLADAGTPAIADPGERLVSRCHKENIAVSLIPGPASPIVALALSGFPAIPFQFIGFLPRKSGELKRVFTSALNYPGTTIAFDSPFRIKKSLALLATLAPDRPLFIARELTKKFEETLLGTPQVLLERWQTSEPKGEFVLVLQGIL